MWLLKIATDETYFFYFSQLQNLSAAGINLQPTLTATPQFIASTPTSMTLPSVSVATAVAPQLQNNAIAAPPVALTQQTQPPLTILPSATQITPGTSVATGATSPTKTPTSARRNLDPNRVPLYEDERLPQGWHRKVSQRKSGASAGR